MSFGGTVTTGEAAQVAKLCYLAIPGVVELIAVEGDESRPREQRIRAMLALRWLSPATALPKPSPVGDLVELLRDSLEMVMYAEPSQGKKAARRAVKMLAVAAR